MSNRRGLGHGRLVQGAAIGAMAVIALGWGAGCAGSGGPERARAEAERQVRAASAAWDEAHNSGNLPALMALYDENAVSMPTGRPALEGRAAIEADFREFFGGFTARHRTTIVELVVDGDWAIERGRYEFSATPKGGGDPVSESGKHIVIRSRRDGTWRIRWEIWNTDGAAP